MRNATTLWLFLDPSIIIVAMEDASLPLTEPSADPRTVASRERLANPTDVVVVVERIERTGIRTNVINSHLINGTNNKNWVIILRYLHYQHSSNNAPYH